MPITINGSGTLTGLSAGGLPDDSVNLADLSATGTASSSTFLRGDNSWTAAGGKIVDVKQVLKTDQWTYSTIDTWVDITGLSITHALSNASNKLLLSYSLSVSARMGGYNMSVRLMDDTTVCAQGDADSSVIRATNGYWGTYYGENQGTLANQILYTPGNTDSNAYHIEARTHYSQGIYLNRTFNWNNAQDEYASTASTLTLMEVEA